MEPEQCEEVRVETTAIQSPPLDGNERSSDSVLTHAGDNTSDFLDSQESWNMEKHAQVQFHSHMAPYALKALLDGGISLIEYGSQLRFRCGYSEVLTVRST